jgi:4-amino-4-deoxy-L-arabinose transferase-like glycosyltransferase
VECRIDHSVSPVTPRAAWLLFAAAVASSIPTFWFYLVGEEGILVNNSIEMWQRGDWLRLWLFGVDHKHGVFANWLIIPAAAVLGWEKAPGIARAVMVLSTVATGLILYVLVRRLYRDAPLAVFAAALFVTFGDILFYRGWLAYRDPLFGMLAFAAIAALWLAVHEQSARWLLAVIVCSALAFLTKGLIVYVFVGAAVFVLLWRRVPRAYLRKPASIAAAFVTLSLPFLWFRLAAGDQSQGGSMLAEIASKLAPDGWLAYLWKLVAYPAEIMLRLAPASLLAILAAYKMPAVRNDAAADVEWRTALAIAFAAFLPFWLAPQSHFRYVLPVVPLLALALAVVLIHAGAVRVRSAMQWLWIAVVLKLMVVLMVFPYYQKHYRGENYALTAHEIVERTKGYPLYTKNVSASGLSVAAYINLRRLPDESLRIPPREWDNGFVIAYEAEPQLGRISERFRLAGNDLYLLCRGMACEKAKK